ncbi:uncharacterized protein ACNS7B_005082 [Menidia menidia]
MMMPIYPGAPWIPKFEGQGDNTKYIEWKEQMQGLLDANDLPELHKVKILIGALSGLPRRQINVLCDNERDKVTKVFAVLDDLYIKKVPVSALRSQFFGCVQKPGESVQAYGLRLRELYRKLQKHDETEAPTDTHLRDQFLLGLEDGAMLQMLKRVVRLDPDVTFSAVQQEALLLEEEQSPKWPEVTCAAVRDPNTVRFHQQSDLWKQELKRELMEEVKAQMKDLARELTKDQRLMGSVQTSVRPRTSSPHPRGKRHQDRHTSYRWDEDAQRQGVKIAARSEVVVWGRARAGPAGGDYCGLVEPLEELNTVSVGRTLAVIRNGRLPVRLKNLNNFPVTLGRYQKIGRLYQVDDVDIHRGRDVDLAVDDSGVVQVGLVEAVESPEESRGFGLQRLAEQPDLTSAEAGKLTTLLQKWEKVFSKHDEDFGRTNAVKHTIPTGDACPTRERFRPLPPLMYKEMRSLLADMLDKGVITESSSPWAAPIVMVKKKDGSWRFCVDYRKLNSVTHKDAFPLPRIEETLTSLSKAEWFSTLDLASGYWQVEVDPKDREKTAFTTPVGLFEFQRMPFELCNAPATFQRLMQQCLSGQIAESLLVYLDDIIVYSPNFDAHLQHLEDVFTCLWKHGLKLRPDKCKLFQREVRFLGHVVNQRGVMPDPDKVAAVTEWAAPKSIKEVRAFLGLAGYYRRFIKGFAKIARPLNSLLTGIPTDKKHGTKLIDWTSECQTAFDKLKEALTQAPILAYADYTQPFSLYTDASNHGLGAVLAQNQEGGERVIAYASRSLHPAERNDANYSSFKLELLALKWAITEKFKDYLTGAQFTVFTDNNPVAHLQTAKLGAVEQRWVAQLASFDFEVKYRAGKENANADALSRFPKPTTNNGCAVAAVMATEDVASLELGEDWQTLQGADPDIQQVRMYVERGRAPNKTQQAILSEPAKKLLKQWRRLCIHQKVLCRHVFDSHECEPRFQIVCPDSKRQEVWRKCHEATAHTGVEKTLAHLRRHFFWPSMEKGVTCHAHPETPTALAQVFRILIKERADWDWHKIINGETSRTERQTDLGSFCGGRHEQAPGTSDERTGCQEAPSVGLLLEAASYSTGRR